jgi:hypothetical protein
MKWLPVILVALLAGCGVEWFPSTTASTGKDAAPAFFNFSSQSVTVRQIIAAGGVDAPIPSNTVTLKGNNANGWPVVFTSFTGAHATLTVSDNSGGLAITYAPGTTADLTVLPGQTLMIEQTPTLTIGQSTTSQVTVGTFTANFILSTVR